MHQTWELLLWCAIASFVSYALGRVWDELKQLFRAALPRHAPVHCQAYCPGCRKDLVSSVSSYWDDDLVYYTCSECGVQSRWDFDTPVPVLLASSNRDADP